MLKNPRGSSRRHFLKVTGAAAASLAVSPSVFGQAKTPEAGDGLRWVGDAVVEDEDGAGGEILGCETADEIAELWHHANSEYTRSSGRILLWIEPCRPARHYRGPAGFVAF